MRRLRFASALADLFTAHGVADRAAFRHRVFRHLVEQPDLGRAISAVHAGPWPVPEDAFTPSILSTLALG